MSGFFFITMELNTIQTTTNWGDAADDVNSNFTKVGVELDKMNAKALNDKGYFSTEAALIAAWPNPSTGNTANVAGKIYEVQNGVWVNTGQDAPIPVLDLEEYAKIQNDTGNQVVYAPNGIVPVPENIIDYQQTNESDIDTLFVNGLYSVGKTQITHLDAVYSISGWWNDDGTLLTPNTGATALLIPIKSATSIKGTFKMTNQYKSWHYLDANRNVIQSVPLTSQGSYNDYDFPLNPQAAYLAINNTTGFAFSIAANVPFYPVYYLNVNNNQDGNVQVKWSPDMFTRYRRVYKDAAWSEWTSNTEEPETPLTLFKNVTNANFDKNCIVSFKPSGNKTNLKNADGTFKRLFITWIRLKKTSSDPNSGFEICEMNADGTVGVNNVRFFIGANTALISTSPAQYPVTLSGNDLSVDITLDTSKIPSSILAPTDLGATIELETEYIYDLIEDEEIPSVYPLYSKKILHLGDSIIDNKTIPEQVGKLTGATVYNCAIAGTRLTSTDTTANYSELSICKLVAAIAANNFTAVTTAATNIGKSARIETLKTIDFTKIDTIVISACTNDYSANVPLGAKTDTTSATIMGSVNYIVNTIQTVYPKINIVFTAPIRRKNYQTAAESDTNPNTSGIYLVEYGDAIQAASGNNHQNSLDMYRLSGFTPYNHNTYYEDQSTHLNDAGATKFAQRLAGFLCSIVKY